MQSNESPLIVGITGSIGTGKSTVCKWLSNFYPVYYADELAHDIIRKTYIARQVSSEFKIPLDKNGLLDKNKLAKLVFSNKRKLKKLNNIIHPHVLKKMQSIVNNSNSSIIIFEVPLIFETGIESCFDFVVLIDCPIDMIIKRLIDNKGMTEQEIKKRLSYQIPAVEKKKKADYVIYNNSDINALYYNTLTLVTLLPRIPKKSSRTPFF